MQIQIQGLLQLSVPVFPTAEVSGRPTLCHTTSQEMCDILSSLLYFFFHAERPFGDPATAELYRVQSASANSFARLPRAA